MEGRGEERGGEEEVARLSHLLASSIKPGAQQAEQVTRVLEEVEGSLPHLLLLPNFPVELINDLVR